MLEAIRLGLFLIFFGGLLFGATYVARALVRERIPQKEIDTEARELIAAHGADALSAAQGNVERSQCSKGNNDKIQRAARVLKAVEQSAEYHG